MATETLYMKVDSDIKGVTKDTKELNRTLNKTEKELKDVKDEGKEVVGEMQLLGISVNGLRGSFNSASKGAKFMFRSIKMGIASTGLGVFVLALGSIVTWFTKTKKGAEFLSTAFAGIGAAINVVIDRIAKFGGGMVKILSGDVRGGLKEISGTFKGIGKEIVTDTLNTMVLEKAQQKLIDSNRKLNVDSAQKRADIEKLKLIAEDVTKSESVRLKAAKDAFAIENDLLERKIRNAEKDVKLQQRRNQLRGEEGKMAADLDLVAEKEIALANIIGESTTKQIELNNKIHAIEAEGAAKRQAAFDAKISASKAESEGLTLMPRLVQESNAKIIQSDKEVTDMFLSNATKKTEITKDSIDDQLQAYAGLANALSGLAGDNKELAAAGAIISTYAGATKAFEQGGAVGFVTGAAIIAQGLSNVQRIYSTPIKGSSGGGGGGGGAIAQQPAPQMMSGAFELGGGVAPEPLKAFVVTDEMTNSQNQLANIRRRATI
jgi:hypothetical protein